MIHALYHPFGVAITISFFVLFVLKIFHPFGIGDI
jgi:hypothetical protein